jgi:hypothetical protein
MVTSIDLLLRVRPVIAGDAAAVVDRRHGEEAKAPPLSVACRSHALGAMSDNPLEEMRW